MKFNKYLQCIASLMVFSSSLQAATLDYRHEYADRTRINKDRIAIIETLPNGIGFYVDASVKSGGVDGEQDKYLSDLVTNAIELGASYNYKITDRITLQPGFIFESGQDTSIYKPYLKVQYNLDSGIYIAGRYRYDYARKTAYHNDDEKTNRFDTYIGYNFDKLNLGYNFTWMDSNQIKYDNKKTNYEHNMALSWKLNKSFTPYAEVGNVAVKNNSDERQTRYRVGLQYNF
ncbi:outer membrane beta-barrel domain protein [Yersinia ruckeri]|uniref:oligogalacturonate-specific porin KdgM family protein n=1 Tax=Yersinia ruckeri TaxID=29486 RepID=UPI0005AC04A0|nr:oligogalacturonate-specific porin KdgM family protein [Yersinia ruckeri]AJI96240.1 outer membrane beta-barrel domain protein [Yersinia ruckeri]MCW6566657.1 oligogalacturonate-specific porin KdgM family protein [Yersinia ruckeri]